MVAWKRHQFQWWLSAHTQHGSDEIMLLCYVTRNKYYALQLGSPTSLYFTSYSLICLFNTNRWSTISNSKWALISAGLDYLMCIGFPNSLSMADVAKGLKFTRTGFLCPLQQTHRLACLTATPLEQEDTRPPFSLSVGVPSSWAPTNQTLITYPLKSFDYEQTPLRQILSLTLYPIFFITCIYQV